MSRMRNAHEAIERAKDQRARLIGLGPASLASALSVALLAAFSLLVARLGLFQTPR